MLGLASGRQRAVLLVLLAILGSSSLARSDAYGCFLGGDNGTWQVKKLVLPSQTSIASFGWQQKDPVDFPFVSRETYTNVFGFFILNASTGKAVNWIFRGSSSGAPASRVEIDGTDYEVPQVPSTFFTGLHGGRISSLGNPMPAGTYYVAAFGYGAKEGVLSATGRGTWSASMTTIGFYSCTDITATGELQHFNQADFSGGTQIYLPSIGVGSGLSLTRNVSRSFVVGGAIVSVIADGRVHFNNGNWVGGKIDLKYSTPTGPGRLGTVVVEGIDSMVSSAGQYSYQLEYYGTDPYVGITYLQFDVV